jgi:hypothetical protein
MYHSLILFQHLYHTVRMYYSTVKLLKVCFSLALQYERKHCGRTKRTISSAEITCISVSTAVVVIAVSVVAPVNTDKQSEIRQVT